MGTCTAALGRCSSPLPFADVATGELSTGASALIRIGDTSDETSGFCGGAGTETVVQIASPVSGQLRVDVAGLPEGAVAYLTPNCAIGTDACTATDGTLTLPVTGGLPVLLVLDSDGVVGDVSVEAEIQGDLTVGDACAVDGSTGQCAFGLACAPERLVCVEVVGEGGLCGNVGTAPVCGDSLSCAQGDAFPRCVDERSATCEAAEDLGTVGSITDGPFLEADLNRVSGATLYAGSCGANGRQARVVTPLVDGTLVLEYGADGRGLFARTSCLDAGTELGCINADSREALEVPVVAGEPVYLFLESVSATDLTGAIYPTVGEGDACNPELNRCEQGFRCGSREVCVRGSLAPVPYPNVSASRRTTSGTLVQSPSCPGAWSHAVRPHAAA